MKEINLFSFTQNMTDAVVLEWFVEDGEIVESDQDIVEVESEKATQVMVAPVDGEISIIVEEGEQVDIGQTLAKIDVNASDDEPMNMDEAGDETNSGMLQEGSTTGDTRSEQRQKDTENASDNATTPVAADRTEDRAPELSETSGAETIRASPAARDIARKRKLDLSTLQHIEGRGPGGALTQQDIREEIDASQSKRSASMDDRSRGIYENRDGTQLRQAVASQMVSSADTAPQVTLHRTVSIDPLLDLKDSLERDLGWQLSVSDFLIAAVIETNKSHPEFNAIYEDGTHKLAENINISIAVDLDNGLVTPVIHSADQLSLRELSEARKSLVQSALERKYSGEDLSGGTFTITNLGHFEIEWLTPLLNVPEVAILGIGTIVREPIETESYRVQFESQLGISLTIDHRAVDGADGAKYLASLAEVLEHPFRILSFDDNS